MVYMLLDHDEPKLLLGRKPQSPLGLARCHRPAESTELLKCVRAVCKCLVNVTSRSKFSTADRDGPHKAVVCLVGKLGAVLDSSPQCCFLKIRPSCLFIQTQFRQKSSGRRFRTEHHSQNPLRTSLNRAAKRRHRPPYYIQHRVEAAIH